jgi:hypothetical protein
VQLRLSIAEADERRMEEWRRLYPRDVDYELSFWAHRAAEKRAMRTARAERRRRKKFIEAQLEGSSTIPFDDKRWDYMWLRADKILLKFIFRRCIIKHLVNCFLRSAKRSKSSKPTPKTHFYSAAQSAVEDVA